MSTFGGVYFTNKGRALQAKALTGIQLNFTKIVVGDGTLTGQVISDLSALIHEVKTLTISTLKNTNDGKVTIGGVLTNEGLLSGFYWRELGLFAQDPDLGEILYCYGNAAALAEYIPAGGGADLLEKQINIVAIVGNASSISATLDSSLIYASPGDVAIALAQAEAYAEPKITAASVTDFWSGSKTFRDLATDVRAVILTGLTTITNAAIAATDTVIGALGKLQKQITDHLVNTSNPHSVTKTQVGLSSVDNTSDVNKPVSTAMQTALNLKADGTTLTTHLADNVQQFNTVNASLASYNNLQIMLKRKIRMGGMV